MRVTIFYILGIVAGEMLHESVSTEIWLAIVVFLVIASMIIPFTKFRWKGSVLLMASMGFGGAMVTLSETSYDVIMPEQKITYEAVVVSRPVIKEKTVTADLLVTSGRFRGRTLRASLLKDTVGHRYRSLHVGSLLQVHSRIEKPRRFDGSHFDYPMYLKCHGILGSTFVYHSDWKSVPVSLTALGYWQRAKLRLLMFRDRLIQSVKGSLTDETLAIVSAMTLGDKTMLKADVRNVYSQSGASHILALSGLHLSIIYMVLTFWCRRRRWLRLIMLAAVWAYVVMVGMMPSVVRAASMLTLLTSAQMLHRGGFPLHTLSMAALLILIASPLSLFDVGFQLSFLAVLFILLCYGDIERLWKPHNAIIRWAWQLTAVSISAQIGTIPIVAYYFGRLPLYALPANLIVIPTTMVILILSIVLFFPVVGCWVAPVIAFLVSAQYKILTETVALPLSGVTVSINLVQTLLVYVLYVVIFLVYRTIHSRQPHYL